MLCARYCVAVFISIFCVNSYGKSSVKNVEEFLQIVEEMAPELQIQKGELAVSEKSVDKAKQFLNPDINIGTWSGRANDINWKQTDVTLLQPIELGGKRSGRIKYAKAQKELVQNQYVFSKSNIRAFALLTLHDLRQTLNEKLLIEEAQTAFDKLIKNYKKRPQLSPEQTTSLFLFQMAKRDYDLQLVTVQNELLKLEMEIQRISGLSLNDVKKYIPSKVDSWPSLQLKNSVVMAPEISIAKAQVSVSASEVELAKSESWPTLSIGPSYTNQSQFGEQAKIWGMALSTKLPVLSLNLSGRAAALQNLNLKEKQLQIENDRILLKKNNLIESYNANINVLKKSNVETTVHKKHEQIENYFLKGLVNSALVIEAHRQIVDSQKTYNTTEMSALDTYYQLLILDGQTIRGDIL